VVWLVGRHIAFIALTGVSVGVAASWVMTRFMEGLLFQIDALDPVTFASIATFLLGVAVLAGVVPARRASRIDPLRSLRTE
jgi:putative ABC transport system permease protein